MTPPRYPLRATRRGSVLTAVVFAAALAVPLVNAVPASATPLVSAGDILVVDRDLSGTGKVIDVDPSTGAQSVLLARWLLQGSVRGRDSKLMANSSSRTRMQVGGPVRIIRVNLADRSPDRRVLEEHAGEHVHRAFRRGDRSGRQLLRRGPGRDRRQGAVFKVNATTGAQTVISQDPVLPQPARHRPRCERQHPRGR